MLPRKAEVPQAGRFGALALSLRLGAIYDWAYALALLALPSLLVRLLGLPLPGEPFYLNVIAALLAIVGAAYWLAATDPESYRALVWIAIAGRFLGFALLALPTVGRP